MSEFCNASNCSDILLVNICKKLIQAIARISRCRNEMLEIFFQERSFAAAAATPIGARTEHAHINPRFLFMHDGIKLNGKGDNVVQQLQPFLFLRGNLDMLH